MCTKKLVKFKPLANEDDLCRVIRTIKTGEFWCSKLWDMNDPMEGVYFTEDGEKINKIFDKKKRFVICSFSSDDALENPLLWGYYANGFKGIALEVEVDEEKIIDKEHKEQMYNKQEVIGEVEYMDLEPFQNASINNVVDIITRKLSSWETEKEYRFLKDSTEGWHKISEIKRVYFGDPYGKVVDKENKEKIISNSKTIKRYLEYRAVIEDLCDRLDIDVYYTKIEWDNKVKVNCSLSQRSTRKGLNGTGSNRG